MNTSGTPPATTASAAAALVTTALLMTTTSTTAAAGSTSPPPTQLPQCFASPGSYCTPYSQILLCSEDRYCPGGILPPIKCPGGKWSAAGSMYLEDCSDHMNVEFGIVLSLLLILFALALCWWWTRYAFQVDYERENEWRNNYRNSHFQDSRAGYGACSHYPQPQDSHRVSIASGVPMQPMNMPRYSRVACGPGSRV